MTLFCELYAMAKTCSLSMLITADASTGKLTVNVLPKPKSATNASANADTDAQEAALMQPLCLTATPEEFDQDFVAALRSYRECRHSLSQQAAATCDLLKAAKEASAKKAATAVSKAQRPAGKGAPTASTPSRHVASPGSTDDDHDDHDEGHGSGEDHTADSPHEDEGHAVGDAAKCGGTAIPVDAGQPQLFG